MLNKEDWTKQNGIIMYKYGNLLNKSMYEFKLNKTETKIINGTLNGIPLSIMAIARYTDDFIALGLINKV